MAILSTQQFLEIDQIKDGILILKNKALRGIMMVNSINFALMSEDEQNAIISQYQSFLNSLDFSLQVVIQSRRLNITSYLDKLRDLETRQSNDLLRTQIVEYRNFINEIVSGGSIMNKTFYVVVPFQPAMLNITSTAGTKTQKTGRSKTAEIAQEQFGHSKSQLLQRMEFVALGLRRCGLQCVPLNSLELAEFFWSTHHLEESERGYFPEIPPELIQ
jgi:ribosomal protein S26